MDITGAFKNKANIAPTSGTDMDFTKLPDLPVELQLMVWRAHLEGNFKAPSMQFVKLCPDPRAQETSSDSLSSPIFMIPSKESNAGPLKDSPFYAIHSSKNTCQISRTAFRDVLRDWSKDEIKEEADIAARLHEELSIGANQKWKVDGNKTKVTIWAKNSKGDSIPIFLAPLLDILCLVWHGKPETRHPLTPSFGYKFPYMKELVAAKQIAFDLGTTRVKSRCIPCGRMRELKREQEVEDAIHQLRLDYNTDGDLIFEDSKVESRYIEYWRLNRGRRNRSKVIKICTFCTAFKSPLLAEVTEEEKQDAHDLIRSIYFEFALQVFNSRVRSRVALGQLRNTSPLPSGELNAALSSELGQTRLRNHPRLKSIIDSVYQVMHMMPEHVVTRSPGILNGNRRTLKLALIDQNSKLFCPLNNCLRRVRLGYKMHEYVVQGGYAESLHHPRDGNGDPICRPGIGPGFGYHHRILHSDMRGAEALRWMENLWPFVAPNLETVYIIDRGIRLKPGASLPDSTRPVCFGNGCKWVEVKEPQDFSQASADTACPWIFDERDSERPEESTFNVGRCLSKRMYLIALTATRLIAAHGLPAVRRLLMKDHQNDMRFAAIEDPTSTYRLALGRAELRKTPNVKILARVPL
ncbi:hypothetical protein QBC44DRAFT_366808 [Cladorrhinum sp. PSN332]|nr:hypothetical protein QBC44DRAFT_366808 [Cladorrhinum sp. PSN332]